MVDDLMASKVFQRLQDFIKSFSRTPPAEFQINHTLCFRAFKNHIHKRDSVTVPRQPTPFLFPEKAAWVVVDSNGIDGARELVLSNRPDLHR